MTTSEPIVEADVAAVDAAAALGRRPVRGMFLVWQAYQRRSEVLAPLLGADLVFMPHIFHHTLFRPIDYLLKAILSTVRILICRPRWIIVQSPPHFAALPALMTGSEFVIDAHNAVFQSQWRRYPLASYVMRKASAIIVHNQEIAELACRQFPHSVYCMIGDPVTEIRPSAESARDEHQILFICSFKSDEPVDVIIQVIEALPGYDFVITADPTRLPARQQKRLANCRNLKLTGYLSTADYHEVLCSSAAAIALTENDATQQSGACEALSSNTPLITSRSSLSEALFGDWATLVENTPGPIIEAIRSLPRADLDLSSYRQRWNEKTMDGIRELRSVLALSESSR